MNQNAEESANPALFLSDEGFAISFHLILAEEEAKNELVEKIWNCGGRVEKDYCQMQPKTVLLVDQQTHDNMIDLNRISFKHQYINDCITKNQLLNLTDYLYYKDVEDTPEYFLDVIYYRIRDFRYIEKFPDEKDNLYTVMSLSPVASVGSPPGTSSSMLGSNISRKMLLPLSFNTMSNGNEAFFSHNPHGISQSQSSLTSPESISTKSKLSKSTSSNIALNCLLKTLNQAPKRTKVGGFKFHNLSHLKIKAQHKEGNSLNKSNKDKTGEVKILSKMTLETSRGENDGLQIENIENQEKQQSINSNKPQKVNENKILKTCKNNFEINILTKDKVLEKGKHKLVEPFKVRNTKLKGEDNNVVKIIKKKDIIIDNSSSKNQFTAYRNKDNNLQQSKSYQTKKPRKVCIFCNIKNNENLKTKNIKLFKTDNMLNTQSLVNKQKPTPKPIRTKLVGKESMVKNKAKDSAKSTSLLKQIGHASIRKKLKDNNLMNKSILSLRSSTNLMNQLKNISRDSTKSKPKNKSDMKSMQIPLLKLKLKQNKPDSDTLKIYSKIQHNKYSKNEVFEESDKKLIQRAINRRVFVRLTRISMTKFAYLSGTKVKPCSKSKDPPSMVTTRQAKRNNSQEFTATKTKILSDNSNKMKISQDNGHKNKLETSNRCSKIKKLQTITIKTNENPPKTSFSRKNIDDLQSAFPKKKKHDSKAEKSKNKTIHRKIDKLQDKQLYKISRYSEANCSKKRIESNSKCGSKLRGNVLFKKSSFDSSKKKEAECIKASSTKVDNSKLTGKAIKKSLIDKDICTDYLSIPSTKNELRNGLSRGVLKSVKKLNNLKHQSKTNCKDKKENIKVLRSSRLLRRITLNSNS